MKAEKFERFFVAEPSQVNLDKTKKNILIIETVERHFRERFAKPYRNLQPTNNQTIKYKIKEENILKSALEVDVPYNTERHETLLFSSDFFLRFKEWKAYLNWKVFGRIDEKVVLSKDQKYLLYYLDAQPNGITSSFDNDKCFKIALPISVFEEPISNTLISVDLIE